MVLFLSVFRENTGFLAFEFHNFHSKIFYVSASSACSCRRPMGKAINGLSRVKHKEIT
jgi:hypothetical protein